MLIQRISRSDPEKIFVVVRNDESTASAPAGSPVAFNFDGTRDGVDVVNADAAANVNNLVGNAHAAIAAGDYGLAQVYGYDSDGVVYGTDSSIAVGDSLGLYTGGTIGYQIVATGCSANLIDLAHVACAETYTSSAATTNVGVFLRLL